MRTVNKDVRPGDTEYRVPKGYQYELALENNRRLGNPKEKRNERESSSCNSG